MRQSRRFGLGKSTQYTWKKYNVAEGYIWYSYPLQLRYYWNKYNYTSEQRSEVKYTRESRTETSTVPSSLYEYYMESSGSISKSSTTDIPSDWLISSSGWYIRAGAGENSSATSLPTTLTLYEQPSYASNYYKYEIYFYVNTYTAYYPSGNILSVVNSTNSNAYPTYDVQGGYFYQYDHNAQEKSSTYSTLSSSSRNAHNDNGVDSSTNTWTEYQGYSRGAGTQVGSVQSYNANDYPSNGIASDGYWYILQ